MTTDERRQANREASARRVARAREALVPGHLRAGALYALRDAVRGDTTPEGAA